MKCEPVYRFLGVWVNALTITDLNRYIQGLIDRREKSIIANHNLHSVYIYHHDGKMRDFYARADCIHIDSMILVFIGRLFGFPFQKSQRVTYIDWTDPLMREASEKNWKIFYVGSKEGVAAEGAEKLRMKFPRLQIETAHGYFDIARESPANQTLIEKISRYKPNVLMVGMGMPRQEHWVLNVLDQLDVNAVLLSGAAIDYVAGVVPTPPRWAGQMGLEWLFRLCAEPRRLGRRYLIEPWFILRLIFLERVLNKKTGA